MKKLTLGLFLIILSLSVQTGFCREDYKSLLNQQVGKIVTVVEKDSTISHTGKLIKMVSNAFVIEDNSGVITIFHVNHIKYMKTRNR